MTFAWFRRRTERIKEAIVQEVKPVWLSVEDRLAQIARSQSELNNQAVEIKIITSSIVKALGLPDETAEVLKELTPVLREIPPLLKMLPPVLKSIDGQFAALRVRPETL
jgi:hypothetical protein